MTGFRPDALPQRLFPAEAVGIPEEERMQAQPKNVSPRAAGRNRTFDVINPATGQVIASHPISTAAQVRAKVARARDAFRPWSKLDPEDRAVFLSHFAEILRKHKEDYAPTMTREMGKVIRESLAEVGKVAWAAHEFARTGPSLSGP